MVTHPARAEDPIQHLRDTAEAVIRRLHAQVVAATVVAAVADPLAVVVAVAVVVEVVEGTGNLSSTI